MPQKAWGWPVHMSILDMGSSCYHVILGIKENRSELHDGLGMDSEAEPFDGTTGLMGEGSRRSIQNQCLSGRRLGEALNLFSYKGSL